VPADMTGRGSADPGAADPGAIDPAASDPAARSGVIHDLGYRRYDGPRLGRAQIGRALAWHSLRSAFGAGRGIKAKIIPVITFVIMCLPAVVNAVAVALSTSHTRAVPYDTYLPGLRVLVMTVFIAAQAPELVSRDLRSHVLPLYFARPVRRLDYPLAKLAAFTAACLIMIEIPELLLYLGTVVQAHGGSAIWAETRALIPGLLVGLMWAVVLAAIGLALASFSGRRAFATGTIAIVFFLSWTLAGTLGSIVGNGAGPGAADAPAGAHLAGLVSPFTVLDGVREWLGGSTSRGIVPDPGHYGPAYGLTLLIFLGAGAGALIARYRKAGTL
jgi:ABC-2 type transport system permease protein